MGYLFYVLIEKNMIKIANHLCKTSYLRTSEQNKNSSLPLKNEEKKVDLK